MVEPLGDGARALLQGRLQVVNLGAQGLDGRLVALIGVEDGVRTIASPRENEYRT